MFYVAVVQTHQVCPQLRASPPCSSLCLELASPRLLMASGLTACITSISVLHLVVACLRPLSVTFPATGLCEVRSAPQLLGVSWVPGAQCLLRVSVERLILDNFAIDVYYLHPISF